MNKKVKITDFKTKRINHLTGGKISIFSMPDYPKSKDDDGILTNSFMTLDGTYIGDYAQGWWYVQKNMVVCNDYPHGVSIVLKSNKPKIILKNAIKDKFESRFCEQWENDNLIGYYGYSYRGGQTFKIGDRLFDETYQPKESDYTKKEWAGFEVEREKCIIRNLAEGFCETREAALRETSISDVIMFKLRGTKLIETWDEAKQAAINMSKYLS